jgi:hypothetical protein
MAKAKQGRVTKNNKSNSRTCRSFEKYGGDDETRTRDLCRDSVLSGAAKSLKGTVGTVRCG